MRDDLRDFRRRDAVVERQVDVVRHLDRLAARDQHGERHHAAVARRQAGPLPDLAEEAVLRVRLQRWGGGPDIVRLRHGGDHQKATRLPL